MCFGVNQKRCKYDLHPTRSGKGYLVDVQSDLLEMQRTRMVVPLLPLADVPNRVHKLHPVITVEGSAFVLATHLMGAVADKQLLPAISSLSDHADEITHALDFLFQGF